MGMDDDAQIVSVIGGARRSGRWRVPGSTKTITLLGRCLIDLRQAETVAEEIQFDCISAFAVVTFIVPEGAEVRPSGMAILGSARSLVPVSAEPCHLPPISIDAITVIGRLRIRTTVEEPESERNERKWCQRWQDRRAEAAAAKADAKAKAKAAEARTAAVDPRELVDLAPFDRIPEPAESRELVDLAPIQRTPEPSETRELVDLAPVQRIAEERELVDLPPIRRPVDAGDATSTTDSTERPAVALFETRNEPAPQRPATSYVDPPIPAGSIDEIPAAFSGFEAESDRSPLTDVEVPDTPSELSDDTVDR